MQPIALIGARTGPWLRTALSEAKIDIYNLGAVEDVDADCLMDIYGDFRRLYGMTGDFLCLIRPDDHIGLFQRPPNERSFREYLARIA